jgi:hypothetical protein
MFLFGFTIKTHVDVKFIWLQHFCQSKIQKSVLDPLHVLVSGIDVRLLKISLLEPIRFLKGIALAIFILAARGHTTVCNDRSDPRYKNHTNLKQFQKCFIFI